MRSIVLHDVIVSTKVVAVPDLCPECKADLTRMCAIDETRLCETRAKSHLGPHREDGNALDESDTADEGATYLATIGVHCDECGAAVAVGKVIEGRDLFAQINDMRTILGGIDGSISDETADEVMDLLNDLVKED